jgi:hypothetical protein
MNSLPKYMAVSLLRFEEPLAVERFVGVELETEVRYLTSRADAFRIDGSIDAETDVYSHITLFEEKSSSDAIIDQLVEDAKHREGLAYSMQLLLRPFMHRGSINWLDPINAGEIFEAHRKPSVIGPVAVLTSGGFEAPETQMERVGRTVKHTVMVAEDALRAKGLKFRRVFSLCETLGDPITFSVWESEDDIAKFAYQPGEHLNRVQPQLKSEFHFDRTSFTRFSIERAHGEWEGVTL